MSKASHLSVIAMAAIVLPVQSLLAQLSTSAATPEELESIYTLSIENRTQNILQELDLKDGAKTAQVHNAIIAFYRALRARDAVVDVYLESKGMDTAFNNPERITLVEPVSGQLHTLFFATLSTQLSPEQVEIVKDKMTYGKVKVTFDAYCEIFPDLNASEKTMITQKLKAARDEAVNGGSADEKHAVFEVYKEQINATLTSNGHDVDKAFREWEAKKSVAASSTSGADPGN